ncbi:MAG: ATP-binding protein [Lachnospiraceae bacterium]|nr:ATP-binding protein [Lachnospiraceae bacterium]
MFIGRKEELSELESRYHSGRFEMGIVYGARRIGKTSLLQEFSKDKPTLYFQAKESNELDNRTAFSAKVNSLIGVPYSFVYPGYSEGFDALLKYAGNQPFIIVIDEIAFLARSDRGFLSELQYNIDHKFKDHPVKLILSGSTISFMKNILKDKRGPLFQRSTFRMNMKKMLYSDALAFLDGLSAEDKIKYLSLFGEHPYYLEMIDKNKTFDENLRRLLFGRFGTLVDAPDKVLPTASNDQNTYNTILKAIAHRKRTNREIAQYIGKEPNYVASYLPKLMDNEIIEKRESFNRNQKMNYYEISDNLIRFWYRFIFDNQEEILQDMGSVIFDDLQEEIALFISAGFEDVAISYLTEKNITGELGYHYGILRGYKADNSKLGRSVELDGLASGMGEAKNRLLVAECKYRSKALSLAVLEHLRESLTIFPAEHYDIYLFSKSGFADDILALEDPEVHLIDPEKMSGDEKMTGAG